MANIGAITELVNNEKLELSVRNSGDSSDNFWIMLQDCNFNLDRPITREITSDVDNPAVYFFGGGNNSLDFTILLSTTELDQPSVVTSGNLLYLQKRNSNGGLVERYWRVRVTDVSGAVKILKFKSQLPRLNRQRLLGVGVVIVKGTLTITEDSVAVATS